MTTEIYMSVCTTGRELHNQATLVIPHYQLKQVNFLSNLLCYKFNLIMLNQKNISSSDQWMDNYLYQSGGKPLLFAYTKPKKSSIGQRVKNYRTSNSWCYELMISSAGQESKKQNEIDARYRSLSTRVHLPDWGSEIWISCIYSYLVWCSKKITRTN